jgi:hypothetical protein
MVNVKVHTLEDELCSVEVEAGCTGRQLKEAIEEATNWVELVCTQCLALGVNAMRDDEVPCFRSGLGVVPLVPRLAKGAYWKQRINTRPISHLHRKQFQL